MAEFGTQLSEEARGQSFLYPLASIVFWQSQDFDFLGRALEDLGVLGEDSRLMLATCSADCNSPCGYQRNALGNEEGGEAHVEHPAVAQKSCASISSCVYSRLVWELSN